MWVEIWHQGGSEGNCRIRCRGWIFDFPAHVALIDVLATINGLPPRKQ